ncbi:hypothetical protein KAU43_07720 [candidate division WOR-3 bacterium]|nr:hypothetical protein [candidate division WOR-3 bacterium]
MGWKGESRRHSLSRKGIKTNIDDQKRLSVRNFVARGSSDLKVPFSEENLTELFLEIGESKRGWNFIRSYIESVFELEEDVLNWESSANYVSDMDIETQKDFYNELNNIWFEDHNNYWYGQSKLTIGVLSGSEGKLYVETVSQKLIDQEYDGEVEAWVQDKYGSSSNWQIVDPEINISKDSDIKIMKSLGKLQESKVGKGDVVSFKGRDYVVTSETFISHPEQLIGGENKDEGFFAQLFPIDVHAEEPSGFINQSRLTVKKKYNDPKLSPLERANESARMYRITDDQNYLSDIRKTLSFMQPSDIENYIEQRTTGYGVK